MPDVLRKDLFTIEPIDYHTAIDIVIEKHYLHRKAPCSKAFGLFQDGQILGVVIYGVSASSTLLKGIAGEDEKGNIYIVIQKLFGPKSPTGVIYKLSY
jgi:hypothetical protein